jgi:hypothetical protein
MPLARGPSVGEGGAPARRAPDRLNVLLDDPVDGEGERHGDDDGKGDDE